MSTKRRIIKIVIGIEAVVIAAMIVFLFYINSDIVRINRQLKLAQQYLLEEDYEQAIAAFKIVIEIDPKNVDAYLGLAEVYVSTDKLENAVKTLEKAAEQTDSGEILDMLEIHTAEIEQRQLAAQRAAEAASEVDAANVAENDTTSTQYTTAEPLTPETGAAFRGFIVQDGELYYYDEAGNFITGWFDTNNNRYCARDDGRLYKDGEHEIDGTKYLFDQGGICLGKMEEDDAWKQAYIDYLENVSVYHYPKSTLIYIDNDDIPEMVLLGMCEADGNAVLNYSDHKVHEMITNRKYFSYLERQNLLCDSGGHMGEYYDIVYSIINGELTCIGEGNYQTSSNTIDPDLWVNTYYWNGNEVTEEVYYKELGEIYDYADAVAIYDEGISLEEMIDKLGETEEVFE